VDGRGRNVRSRGRAQGSPPERTGVDGTFIPVTVPRGAPLGGLARAGADGTFVSALSCPERGCLARAGAEGTFIPDGKRPAVREGTQPTSGGHGAGRPACGSAVRTSLPWKSKKDSRFRGEHGGRPPAREEADSRRTSREGASSVARALRTPAAWPWSRWWASDWTRASPVAPPPLEACFVLMKTAWRAMQRRGRSETPERAWRVSSKGASRLTRVHGETCPARSALRLRTWLARRRTGTPRGDVPSQWRESDWRTALPSRRALAPRSESASRQGGPSRRTHAPRPSSRMASPSPSETTARAWAAGPLRTAWRHHAPGAPPPRAAGESPRRRAERTSRARVH
jgi:hypothetical protein